MGESLAGLSAPLVLLVAAVVLAAESGLLVGIVLPGVTTALGLGLLSRLGAVAPVSAALTVAAATLLGSQLAFLRARRRDPAGFGVLRRRAGPLLTRASALLARHPATAVAAGRLVGGLRTVAPVVAARSGMRYPRFAAGDVPAALGWATLLVGLGHAAGAALDEVRLAAGLVGLPLLLTALAVRLALRWWCSDAQHPQTQVPEDVAELVVRQVRQVTGDRARVVEHPVAGPLVRRRPVAELQEPSLRGMGT